MTMADETASCCDMPIRLSCEHGYMKQRDGNLSQRHRRFGLLMSVNKEVSDKDGKSGLNLCKHVRMLYIRYDEAEKQ